MAESTPPEQPIPITREFAAQFEGVDPDVAAVVGQTLASHRLDGMTVTPEVVADLVGYATGTVSEDDYNRRAAERAARPR